MGPRAGLDEFGKARPYTGIRYPDRPAGSYPGLPYGVLTRAEAAET